MAVPAGAATTTFYLNSYNATDASGAFCSGANLLATETPPGCGTSITAPIVFESGTVYSVQVNGAVSVWGSWPYRKCGKPEPSSEYASPGRPNTPAGDDAQFRFAEAVYSGKCAKLPIKTSFFQVDLGSGWMHPTASGDPSKPSGDKASTGEQHPYTFSLTGEGIAPQFRFVDYHPSDNSGQFKIVVSP